MKRRLFVAIAFVLFALPAAATDYPIEITVNLTTPGRPYINLADCEAPEEVDLSISWQLEEGIQMWVDDREADVFLSTSDTCSSVTVEIGDTEEDGGDAIVEVNQYSGDFPLQDDTLTLADVTKLDCGSQTEKDYYFCIRWEWETGDLYNNKYIYRGGAPLRFDVKAPGVPVLTEASPGESNLKLQWDPPDDEDIGSYIIYYREEGSEEIRSKTETNGNAKGYQLTGLTNYTSYEVWIAAEDESENLGDESNHMTGTPEPVDDFWEVYRNNGGSEDGGFCFVATAAYGSYQSAMVQPLRAFRDGVLSHSQAGRALIAGYYRYGPRWARAIRGSETHRTMARWSLAPAVAFARVSNRLGLAETLVLLAALAILLMLGWRLVKRHRLGAQSGVPPLVLLLILAGAAPAMAEETVPQHPEADFQLQVRFGPYHPNVDGESGVDGEPFKSVFGSGSELLFELGVDYEIWHGFGTVTAGGSFGFVQFVGKALTSGGEKSTDTTVLNLLPLRLSVGYHFDLLSKKYAIPVIPYVAGGISYYIWWVLDGVGDVAEWEDADGDTFAAQGGIFGMHLFAGVKLLLDFLDEGAAASFYDDVGVVNTFLFAEYAVSWVDGFGGDHMNVGDETFMFGLMMEF
jgi:hypothetical protein